MFILLHNYFCDYNLSATVGSGSFARHKQSIRVNNTTLFFLEINSKWIWIGTGLDVLEHVLKKYSQTENKAGCFAGVDK